MIDKVRLTSFRAKYDDLPRGSIRCGSMTFKVFIDDKFHSMDESERILHGEYDSYETAVSVCKEIVDECLEQNFKPGVTSEGLYAWYKGMGDDPFILPGRSSGAFSAWDYAKEKCSELCRAHQSSIDGS